MQVPFAKLVPGGNPTILVNGALPGGSEWPRLAARLLHPMHIQAEQAGLLLGPAPVASYAGQQPQLPHLQMMGGEFCVNATRAAAFMLARQGALHPCYEGGVHGHITVSGAKTPVYVVVAHTVQHLAHVLYQVVHEAVAEGASAPCCGVAGMAGQALHAMPEPVRLYENAEHAAENGSKPFGATGAAAARLCLHESDWKGEQLEEGAWLVHLPGISHILLDARRHPVPDLPLQHTGPWRQKAGLEECDAAGVVWHMPDAAGFSIVPVVHVRETATEHVETACGSACLALGLSLQQRGVLPIGTAVHVMQPSGEVLTVHLHAVNTQNGSTGLHAYVAGKVAVVAEGTAFL